jgi:cytochrome P450
MFTGIDSQSGLGLPDENINAQCVTFLMAGHETTSGMLSFAIYYLIKNPKIAEKARAEVVDKYAIPAGASVSIVLPMLHRHKGVWGEDAEEFDPDHCSPEPVQAIPPNAYKPFSTGMRACIGRQFALQEATLVLGMLLRLFEPGHCRRHREQACPGGGRAGLPGNLGPLDYLLRRQSADQRRGAHRLIVLQRATAGQRGAVRQVDQ